MKVENVYLRKYGDRWRGVLCYTEGAAKRQETRVLKERARDAAMRELCRWADEVERGPAKAAEEAEKPKKPRAKPRRAPKTVCQLVAAHVDALEAAGAVEASTAARYRTALRNQIGPLTMAIASLTTQDVREWEAGMLARGLSSATVQKAHRLLKAALDEAVAAGEIPSNPMGRVRPPKSVPAKPGINALDSESRARLLRALDAMEPTPVAVAARLSLFTGLRLGEVCALRWVDVCFPARSIWVRNAVGRGKGGTYIKKAKTDRPRDVAMPESLAVQLKGLKARATGAYVVGIGEKHADPQVIGKQWATLSQALGLVGMEGRACTFHDLRHTWATMAVSGGVDIKTVASNLGHANAAMTLNIYASADPEAKRRAASVIDSLLS